MMLRYGNTELVEGWSLGKRLRGLANVSACSRSIVLIFLRNAPSFDKAERALYGDGLGGTKCDYSISGTS